MEWTSEAIAAFGSHEVRLRTLDLSAGGCCVETQLHPPTGQRVGLVLHVDGAPVGTWAEIAWSTTARSGRTPSYVWGLRFVELEDESAARLAAYVDHCFAVDMLDEMLRGDSSPVSLPDAPAFVAGDLDEAPTRIHRHTPVAATGSEFFPMGEGAAVESEATSEIDVESTLTSEVPHTRTVQVDLAELYRQMARPTGLEPTATLAAGWDMGGPEPVADAAPAWSDQSGWNEAPAGDPFWCESPELAAHAQVAWPTAARPEQAHVQPGYETNAFAKAQPFDAPPQPTYPPQGYEALSYEPQPFAQQPAYDPNAFDPNAFDPNAFDPQAFAPAPALEIVLEPAPAQVLTVELAALTPTDLLELKRQRIEAMLSSVPRRAGAPASTGQANAAKSEVATDKTKRPRAQGREHQDTGLRRLFDDALRDIGRED